MTVLVTGALGYLGSRLVRALPDHEAFAGEEVRLLDDRHRGTVRTLGDLPATAEYEFREADVRDEPAVRDAMTGVDTVIHLAAITNVGESFERPAETRAVNRDGALTVFEAACAAGVESFVNVSTCSVYGATDEVVAEDAATDPASPYGEAKLRAERAMRHAAHGRTSLTALRLGTVYGWSPGTRFDTVVNKFCYLAATGQPLTVYEAARGQSRPYLHVRDAVDAMLFAATDAPDGVYNVVGENRRLGEVVAAIEREFPAVTVETVEADDFDANSYHVSDERIRAAGFRPTYSLAEGIAELADQFRVLRPNRCQSSPNSRGERPSR